MEVDIRLELEIQVRPIDSAARCAITRSIDSAYRQPTGFPSDNFGYVMCKCFLSSSGVTNSVDYKPISSLERIYCLKLLGLALILMMFCKVTKAENLQRLPVYQDVEAALESTMCLVREEIVDIRKIHPTLPPDARYNPSCVLLRKCSGCCQSDLHECMPTSIYSTRIEISQQLLSSKSFSYIILNFTQHADCECQSPIHPTCIPRVCSESEVWNKNKCQCEARCAPQECGHRQVWNSDTCRCQCEQCHPNRMIHSRFLQDDVTCICACRHALRNRMRCRKRTRFSSSQCTCVSARSLFGFIGQRRT